MDDQEHTLLHNAIQGDEAALTALLRELTPELRRRVASRIGPQYRSIVGEDDVLQVTFLEAYLQIDRFEPRGDGALLAWVTKIAENNIRDAIRGEQAGRRPSPGDRLRAPAGRGESFDGLVFALGATYTTPSHEARMGEAVTRLTAAIDALPQDYAKVVRGIDLQGRSASDLAGDLGRSVGAVHMLRARAHDALRESLGSASQLFSFGA